MTRVAMRLALNRAVALALAVPFCRREAEVNLLLALAAATFLATGFDTVFFTLGAAAFLGLAAPSFLGAAGFLAAAAAGLAAAGFLAAGVAFLGAAATGLAADALGAAAGLAAAGLAAAGLAAAGLAAPALVPAAAGFFSVFFSAGLAAATRKIDNGHQMHNKVRLIVK